MARPRTIGDDELLAIAREVFLKHGISGATRKIAAAAGISEAAVFNRFPTQRDLLIAAMRLPPVETGEILGPSTGDVTREELVAIAGRTLEYLRNAAPRMLLRMLDPRAGQAGLIWETDRNPLPALRGMIKQFFYPSVKERRLSNGSVENLSNLLALAIFGAAVLETLGLEKELERKRGVAAIVDALWYGLHAQRSKARKR
jgi:AcrR family transcriptional regulator